LKITRGRRPKSPRNRRDSVEVIQNRLGRGLATAREERRRFCGLQV
jgi:hypothetical protein